MNTKIVRKANREDARRLCELASQLGYLCHPKEITGRIEKLERAEEETILVLELDGYVIGWLSMQIVDQFFLEPFIEITGFVVDEKYRSQGMGKMLMDAAKVWIKEKGFVLVRLKTNAMRKDAHRFYENNGFDKMKEQYVYMSILE